MRSTVHDSRDASGEGARRHLRRLPGALFSLLAAACVALCTAACTGGGTGEGGLSVSYRLDPSPPAVGSCALELRLIGADGKPVTGAQVEVEANMDHAGMVPTFATLEETTGGRYDGHVQFTMGGDWYLSVKAKLADGRDVERSLDVKGVRSQKP